MHTAPAAIVIAHNRGQSHDPSNTVLGLVIVIVTAIVIVLVNGIKLELDRVAPLAPYHHCGNSALLHIFAKPQLKSKL